MGKSGLLKSIGLGGDNMVLENVHEYGEEIEVELKDYKEKLCVVSYNECGHNCVCIDAKELYKALKNYFENEKGES